MPVVLIPPKRSKVTKDKTGDTVKNNTKQG